MKITKFEELVDKAVPWFIAVCLFIIFWAVVGCMPTVESDQKEAKDIHVIEIDGCEYLAKNIKWQSGLLTHKGNCKNPIHRCE